MAIIHTFPGTAPPSMVAGLRAEIARAIDLLAAVRERLPKKPEDCEAEHELAVLGEAIRALQAGRPLTEAPDAHLAALVDEALVLADLCGQALNQLDPRRQAGALPLVLQAIAEAMQRGPEPWPPLSPSEPNCA